MIIDNEKEVLLNEKLNPNEVPEKIWPEQYESYLCDGVYGTSDNW